MSLLPLLLEDSFPYASRRWLEPQDFLGPFNTSEFVRDLNQLRSQLAELEKDTSISVDKDRFQANIDVQQFKPEEVSVKLTDNVVTIEGKHEEKQDEHGFISRHFVRRYVLPEDCDIRQLQSKLSSDGVLSISAPKKPQGKQVDYKEIPIIRTGKPIKKIEPKGAEENSAPT